MLNEKIENLWKYVFLFILCKHKTLHMFRNFLKDLLLVITEKNTRRDKFTIPRVSQYDVF